MTKLQDFARFKFMFFCCKLNFDFKRKNIGGCLILSACNDNFKIGFLWAKGKQEEACIVITQNTFQAGIIN